MCLLYSSRTSVMSVSKDGGVSGVRLSASTEGGEDGLEGAPTSASVERNALIGEGGRTVLEACAVL